VLADRRRTWISFSKRDINITMFLKAAKSDIPDAFPRCSDTTRLNRHTPFDHFTAMSRRASFPLDPEVDVQKAIGLLATFAISFFQINHASVA
jgi:hypothetical protein